MQSATNAPIDRSLKAVARARPPTTPPQHATRWACDVARGHGKPGVVQGARRATAAPNPWPTASAIHVGRVARSPLARNRCAMAQAMPVARLSVAVALGPVEAPCTVSWKICSHRSNSGGVHGSRSWTYRWFSIVTIFVAAPSALIGGIGPVDALQTDQQVLSTQTAQDTHRLRHCASKTAPGPQWRTQPATRSGPEH